MLHQSENKADLMPRLPAGLSAADQLAEAEAELERLQHEYGGGKRDAALTRSQELGRQLGDLRRAAAAEANAARDRAIAIDTRAAEFMRQEYGAALAELAEHLCAAAAANERALIIRNEMCRTYPLADAPRAWTWVELRRLKSWTTALKREFRGVVFGPLATALIGDVMPAKVQELVNDRADAVASAMESVEKVRWQLSWEKTPAAKRPLWQVFLAAMRADLRGVIAMSAKQRERESQ